MLTPTEIATNVYRFGQSVCELETVVLRGQSSTTANKKIERFLGHESSKTTEIYTHITT